mmetsp:Transcript_33377/g.93655  ORF Transcript_33377/g.93655 Transcript_33377/m.93655 type:complete len:491 (-) Transcript_33377:85-1557(-)
MGSHVGAKPTEYTSCRSPRNHRRFALLGGVDAYLVAASLGLRSREGYFDFRAAFTFEHNSTAWTQAIEKDFNGFTRRGGKIADLGHQNHSKHFGHYYNCPSADSSQFLRSARCWVPDAGRGSERRTAKLTHGDHPTLVRCRITPGLLERRSGDRVVVGIRLALWIWRPTLADCQSTCAPRGGRPPACQCARLQNEDPRMTGASSEASVFLEMCASRAAPRRQLTVCSQPLYGYGALAGVYAHFLRDWLQHHIRLGVDHFFIYDADGTFAAALEPYVRRGAVSYQPFFGMRYGRIMRGMTGSGGAPLCAEHHAYTHCLVHNAFRSDWVMLLHAPDEYISLGQFPHSPSRLAAVLSKNVYPWRAVTQTAWVYHVPLARQCPGCTCSGTVVGCSARRSIHAFDLTRSSPLLNPEICLRAKAHRCGESLPKKGEPVYQLAVEPDELRVYHYVEFLPRDAGRCERIMGTPCDVLDTSLGRHAPYLVAPPNATEAA